MQLDFFAAWNRRRAPRPQCLDIEGRSVPLELIRHPRARRYVLRVRRDGSVRVTVPRSGSLGDALQFAQEHAAWIGQQLERREKQRERSRWEDGTAILFRGEAVKLCVTVVGPSRMVSFADQVLTVPAGKTDLRASVEAHLWSLAAKELEQRTLALAARHQLSIRRVVVRNQRSRWGSCSPKGTISLNWRLVQAPPSVRDYLIVHELMHLREMNHSARFWRLVQAAEPHFQQAEDWLNRHAHLLHGTAERGCHEDKI